jgi:hypothetical protein
MWFKANSIASSQGTFGQNGPGFVNFWMAGGTTHTYLRWETNSGQSINSNTMIYPGVWYFACGVYDNLSVNKTKIYINGAIDSQDNKTFYPEKTVDISIGSYGGTGFPFNGTIDEVTVWNRALGQNEILALYNASANALYADFTGLDGTYPVYAYAVDSDGIANKTDTRYLTFTQIPQYSNASVNTTLANETALFSANWTDIGSLSGYIFSTNNTGVWINDTWVDFDNQTDILFYDGFESGDFSRWYGISGSPVTSSDYHAGSFSARSSGSGNIGPNWYSGGTTYDTLYARAYLKWDSFPAGAIHHFFDLCNYNGPTLNNYAVVYFDGSKYWLYISVDGETSDYVEIPIALGEWNSFEMKTTISTGNTQVWLNGNLVLDWNASTPYGYLLRYFMIGRWSSSSDLIFNYDDAAVSASYIGPKKSLLTNAVKTLNSVPGTVVGWKIFANDSSNNWNVTSNEFTTTSSVSNGPIYSDVSANSTDANEPALFSANWTADTLSGYIFSTNNTGSWQNDTWSPFYFQINGSTDWSYRKSHLILNSTGADSNYAINITVVNGTGTDSATVVYIDNKTRPDFGDIRFTNSSGGLLSYLIENYTSGTNATF